MRVLLAILFFVCFGAGRPAQAVQKPVSVQQTALELIAALKKPDLKAAKRLTLSFEQWRRLSKRALDAGRHQRLHEGFLHQLSAGFRGGSVVEKLELKDSLILPVGEKTRQQVIMAVFHMSLRMPGGQKNDPVVVPLLFVQVDGGWRLMVRN